MIYTTLLTGAVFGLLQGYYQFTYYDFRSPGYTISYPILMVMVYSFAKGFSLLHYPVLLITVLLSYAAGINLIFQLLKLRRYRVRIKNIGHVKLRWE